MAERLVLSHLLIDLHMVIYQSWKLLLDTIRLNPSDFGLDANKKRDDSMYALGLWINIVGGERFLQFMAYFPQPPMLLIQDVNFSEGVFPVILNKLIQFCM